MVKCTKIGISRCDANDPAYVIAAFDRLRPLNQCRDDISWVARNFVHTNVLSMLHGSIKEATLAGCSKVLGGGLFDKKELQNLHSKSCF
jgi:hypothetical protein